MANLSFDGSSDQRTPTLRKWLTTNKAPKPEQQFLIKMIFVSEEYHSITMVTEKFKVAVYDSNPLYLPLSEMIGDCADREIGMAVSVTQVVPLKWDVLENAHEVYSWELTEWGYRVKHTGTARSPVKSRSDKPAK